MNDSSTIYYKRSRFTTRLPTDRIYTPSHFWLAGEGGDLWRVGMTKFATRMLGDLVEHGFDVKVGQNIKVGQIVGWVEGFKAVSDLYSVAAGQFEGGNDKLSAELSLIDTEPYGEGWLYKVRGAPDPNSMSVEQYIKMLDETIDRMLEARAKPPETGDQG